MALSYRLWKMRVGLFSRNHCILDRKYQSTLVFANMTQPENEDELSEEKQKKEGYSIIVVLIGVMIIGVSFVWHLWSALFPSSSP